MKYSKVPDQTIYKSAGQSAALLFAFISKTHFSCHGSYKGGYQPWNTLTIKKLNIFRKLFYLMLVSKPSVYHNKSIFFYKIQFTRSFPNAQRYIVLWYSCRLLETLIFIAAIIYRYIYINLKKASHWSEHFSLIQYCFWKWICRLWNC